MLATSFVRHGYGKLPQQLALMGTTRWVTSPMQARYPAHRPTQVHARLYSLSALFACFVMGHFPCSEICAPSGQPEGPRLMAWPLPKAYCCLDGCTKDELGSMAIKDQCTQRVSRAVVPSLTAIRQACHGPLVAAYVLAS